MTQCKYLSLKIGMIGEILHVISRNGDHYDLVLEGERGTFNSNGASIIINDGIGNVFLVPPSYHSAVEAEFEREVNLYVPLSDGFARLADESLQARWELICAAARLNS